MAPHAQQPIYSRLFNESPTHCLMLTRCTLICQWNYCVYSHLVAGCDGHSWLILLILIPILHSEGPLCTSEAPFDSSETNHPLIKSWHLTPTWSIWHEVIWDPNWPASFTPALGFSLEGAGLRCTAWCVKSTLEHTTCLGLSLRFHQITLGFKLLSDTIFQIQGCI